MRRTPSRNTNRFIIDNLMWFSASLLLAFIVWITANLELNPIIREEYPATIPIRAEPSEDMIIISTNRDAARVEFLATQSVLNQLDASDIDVFADLTGLGPGSHLVPLQATVNRQASVTNISPNQISIELEVRQEKLVPVVVGITNEVPASFERDAPVLSVSQVLVTGPREEVMQVVAVNAELDLGDARESLETNLRLQPVDADDEPVEQVMLEPDVVGVSVDIEPRNDVREVRVTPNIVGEPPDGYTLTPNFDYQPEAVFVSGPPDLLTNLPGTFFTAPIDLTERTSDFSITVPVELPNDGIVLLTGQRITVSVGINAVISSRQFEQVPVQAIGISEGVSVIPAPEEVTVLVNGPQPVLNDLTADDVSVVVDLSDLTEVGSYAVTPRATVASGQISNNDISVLPENIDVQITRP